MHDAPDLFDRQRRAMRRARTGAGDDIIGATIADMLIERFDDVTRRFTRALVVGARDPALIATVRSRVPHVDVVESSAALAQRAGAMCGEEDQLDVPPASYDLIIWPGGLDSVNDVPGAMLRVRLALLPDGLMLAAFVGGDSFPILRGALRAGRILVAPESAVARANPQIDVRGGGDLLQRAGFALPVTDVDTLTLRYTDALRLIGDLRSAALTALIAGPVPPMTRSEWAAVSACFAAEADTDGRVSERLRIVHLSGWAPHASQPQPAARGSGRTSLHAALRPPQR
jgi:hypothetical protein